MLIPLRPNEQQRDKGDANHDIAFEKFLLEEGLQLLRSFRAIEPPELRYALQKLIETIRASLQASVQQDVCFDDVWPIVETAIVSAQIAQHGSVHAHELTTAEIELVCRALLKCQATLASCQSILQG